MSTFTDRHDDSASSLGDSAYDILSNSTAFSEDENDRAAESLVSLRRPDDVESLVDTESGAETASTGAYTESEDLSSSGFLPLTPSQSAQSEEYDRFTTGSSSQLFPNSEPHLTSTRIEFQEPQDYDDAVSVVHPVCLFDNDETERLVQQFEIISRPPSLVATVRQTMAKSSLILHEPFRVLYVGNAVAKGDIIEKIGAALAASNSDTPVTQAAKRRSSRFNVIPVSSFGSTETPEVALIDSFGLELVVDECTFAKNKRGSGLDQLQLHINDRFWCQSKRNGESVQLDAPLHWRLPHVAVFFCSEADTSTMRQTRHFTRSFMLQHKIPFITISQNLRAVQQTEKWALNDASLQMAFEAEGEILRELPVGLTTFLNIDARQLNRHLAFITQPQSIEPDQSMASQATIVPGFPEPSEKPHEASKPDQHGAVRQVKLLKQGQGRTTAVLVLMAWILAIVLAGTLANVAYIKVSKLSQRTIEPTIHLVKPQCQLSSTVTLMSQTISTQTSSAVTSLSTAGANSLAVSNLDLAGLLFDPKAAENDTDTFRVHVLGDSHVILLPPQRFKLLKTPPKVFVKVEKNKKVLDVKLSKLSDGVYSLALDLNDAYGVMNVSVWTKSKPQLSQQFTLDFGTPWLKVMSWRKAADSLAKDLHKSWSLATKGATDMQQYVFSSLPAMGKHAIEVQEFVANALPKVDVTKVISKVDVTKVVPKMDKIACQAALYRAQKASKSLSKHLAKRSEKLSRDIVRKSNKITREIAIYANDMTVYVSREATLLRQRNYAPELLKRWGRVWNVDTEQQIKRAQNNARRIIEKQAKQLKQAKDSRKAARKAKREAKAKSKSCSRGKRGCSTNR